MTRDQDSTTDYDLERLQWLRTMSKFKHATITVQEQDEESCLDELDRAIAKFAEVPDEWEKVSLSYIQRAVQTGPETTIVVWELEAQIASYCGLLPWADSMKEPK